MTTIVGFALILAGQLALSCAFASGVYYYPAVRAIQQYHAQDTNGQYAYGYAEPLSSKREVRTLDGITRGSYSYVDATGQLQTVDYTADADGFHVTATNLPRASPRADTLPQSVTETPEVAAARRQHLAAHRRVRLRDALPGGDQGDSSAEQLSAVPLDFPRSVEDTAEVAAAKVQFFKRYEEEKLRNRQRVKSQTALQAFALLKSSSPILVASASRLPTANAPVVRAPLADGFLYNVVVPQRGFLA